MYDIVFISYKESNADRNWEILQSRYPMAKRVTDVEGIHQAHVKAARKCFTKMFWVVDGDAEIVPEFAFNYEVTPWDEDVVHVWRSINPINGLMYGYGGVKLLPRKLTLRMDLNSADMTTSISSKFKAITEISNITTFNTDAFSTWRSAFRECVKLSSRVIHNQDDTETAQRLMTWCSHYPNKMFSDWAFLGAEDGKLYGMKNANDPNALKKINDFRWLSEYFSRYPVSSNS